MISRTRRRDFSRLAWTLAAILTLPLVASASSDQQTHAQPPRTFSVAGAVAHPGAYEWSDGLTVKQGIEKAGGFAMTSEGAATIDRVTITRHVKGQQIKLHAAAATPVLADDQITVPIPARGPK